MGKSRYVVTVLAALAIAFVSSKYLPQGTPLVTIPWGIITLVLGLIASRRREALLLGGSFGFVASYAYLWFDNSSTLTLGKIIFLIFLIIMPALFGLLCGLGASWLGWKIQKRLR